VNDVLEDFDGGGGRRRIRFPLDPLKEQLKEETRYKILFNYSLPIHRILSLVAIYSVKALELTKPEIDALFVRTKQEIKNLFNTVISNADEEWWNKEIPEFESRGGSVGMIDKENLNKSPQGSDPSLAKLAAETIPILIRGMAEQFDPSYMLMKILDDVGVLPDAATGPNFAALPFVLPVNVFGPFPFGIGIGPPITPLGLAALSVPPTPAHKEKTKTKKKIMKKARGEEVVEDCEDEE